MGIVTEQQQSPPINSYLNWGLLQGSIHAAWCCHHHVSQWGWCVCDNVQRFGLKAQTFSQFNSYFTVLCTNCSSQWLERQRLIKSTNRFTIICFFFFCSLFLAGLLTLAVFCCDGVAVVTFSTAVTCYTTITLATAQTLACDWVTAAWYG